MKLQNKNSGFGTLLILVLVGLVGIAAVVAFGIFDIGKLRGIPQTAMQEDQVVKELNVLGTSDEVVDIEKYLDQTSLDKIDQELPQVDKSSEGL